MHNREKVEERVGLIGGRREEELEEMTTFNTNVVGCLDTRTTVGPTKIRSPTRYSDMFVGAEEDVIDLMMEEYRTGW